MIELAHKEYYVARAHAARQRASAARDPAIRTILEGMAASYDSLIDAAVDAGRTRQRAVRHQ